MRIDLLLTTASIRPLRISRRLTEIVSSEYNSLRLKTSLSFARESTHQLSRVRPKYEQYYGGYYACVRNI